MVAIATWARSRRSLCNRLRDFQRRLHSRHISVFSIEPGQLIVNASVLVAGERESKFPDCVIHLISRSVAAPQELVHAGKQFRICLQTLLQSEFCAGVIALERSGFLRPAG